MASCRLAAKGAFAATLAVLVVACGGSGGSDDEPPAPPPAVNNPPVFTSSPNVSVSEDTAGVFYTAVANDPDGDALLYAIAGGNDAALFGITNSGGLSFVEAPDFENPRDANGDNVYQVHLSVNDGEVSTVLELAVTVTDVASVAYRVRRVVSGYDLPVGLTAVPDGSGRVFVTELDGRIRILDPVTGMSEPEPFLDITGQISTDGERGLLGFTPAPDFVDSAVFYIFATDLDGTLQVIRYTTLADDRDRADPDSADPILRIPHPRSNHNGGWMAFGPDSMLYIATGDGGGAGDPDDNAQDRTSLLGKILRIDPIRDDYPNDDDRDYAIPDGNPFDGFAEAREIWAYGLRNPFRNSFDRETGALLIGDVGQNAREEVNLMTTGEGGANFGWPILEGTRQYSDGPTTGLTPPVAEYEHGIGLFRGQTVIGGYVYRGPVESLRGEYIFADFVSPNLWSVAFDDFELGRTMPSSGFTQRNSDFAPDVGGYNNIVAFGEDAPGNLYILDFDGEIFVIEADP